MKVGGTNATGADSDDRTDDRGEAKPGSRCDTRMILAFISTSSPCTPISASVPRLALPVAVLARAREPRGASPPSEFARLSGVLLHPQKTVVIHGLAVRASNQGKGKGWGEGSVIRYTLYIYIYGLWLGVPYPFIYRTKIRVSVNVS